MQSRFRSTRMIEERDRYREALEEIIQFEEDNHGGGSGSAYIQAYQLALARVARIARDALVEAKP